MAGVTVLHNSISPIIETRNVHRGKKLLKDLNVMDMVQQFIAGYAILFVIVRSSSMFLI